MKIKCNNVSLEIDELFLLVTFSCLVSKSIRIYFSNYFVCMLFAIFHETSHILVASVMGINPRRIRIKLAGLNAQYLSVGKSRRWAFIYLAGPLSNFLMAVIFKNVKIVFEVNMALGLINLIPIKPLDGFNLLKIFVKEKKINIIQKIAIFLLVLLSIYIVVVYKNISLVILMSYIFLINMTEYKTTKCYNKRHSKQL